MYKMKADGVVFYDPSADEMSMQVLSPKASYELNKAGSLDFTVLPGNALYYGLHKLKTIITLEQDDEIIFCGRVMETVTDLHNQKEVYCEGELNFLLDSIVRPYKFEGKAADLFRKLLTAHNEQVEEYKRFEIGIITAVDDDDELSLSGDSFSDTLSEIRSLLIDEHGGYLRVRRENGVRYLDYVSAFNQTCSQEINFGQNLIDIENKVNAQEVCTVLVPVGKHVNGEYTSIARVNDGKDYIEDTEGVEKYGRIIKTCSFDEVIDPAELLELGLKHMAKLKAETTLTITSVDMHACGADVDGIHLGDTVHLYSIPHGLDKNEVCTGIELNIENPEKSQYTFGLPQETLTESNANTVKNFSSMLLHQHRWLTETDDALNITVDSINLIGHRTTQLEIDVNAAEEAITMKASQKSVDILEEKNTAVELRLDAAEGAITAKADRFELEGFLTVEDSAKIAQAISAQDVFCNSLSSTTTVWAEGVNTGDLTTSGLRVNGSDASWKGGTVVTGIGTVSQSKRFLNVMLADGSTTQLDIVTDVSITPSTAYIEYLGKG